jgi:hypothetical protein
MRTRIPLAGPVAPLPFCRHAAHQARLRCTGEPAERTGGEDEGPGGETQTKFEKK